jgi:phosphate uptake regulator
VTSFYMILGPDREVGASEVAEEENEVDRTVYDQARKVFRALQEEGIVADMKASRPDLFSLGGFEV